MIDGKRVREQHNVFYQMIVDEIIFRIYWQFMVHVWSLITKKWRWTEVKGQYWGTQFTTTMGKWQVGWKWYKINLNNKNWHYDLRSSEIHNNASTTSASCSARRSCCSRYCRCISGKFLIRLLRSSICSLNNVSSTYKREISQLTLDFKTRNESVCAWKLFS